MKLSVWSNYFWELTPEGAAERLARGGMKWCELSSDHALKLMERGDPAQTGRAFREFTEKLGIRFLQGHLWLEAKICRGEDREFLRRELELFRAIGIQNAVLHTDSLDRCPDMTLQEKRDANEAALRELTDCLRGSDTVICIENMRNTSITKTADDILYFIHRLDSPNLGVCLDTGHLNLSREPDQAAFIRAVGNHLRAIHITDNEGVQDLHIMPFENGTVDFAAVLSETKKQGYEGLYDLEILADANCPLPIRDLKLEYIQKAFAWLDSVT